MKFGIDLGGSHVAIGLVDENSEIIEKRTYYMNDRRNVSLENYIVSSIVHGINEILQSTRYNLCQIESIGIATPGNPKDGYIKNVVNLGIKEFNITQKLREAFGSKELKINIQNDGKCAALAEKYKGSLKDYNDCVFLCIGTGIGGAAFFGGKFIRPIRNAGFEFGHMVINKNGEQCNCGNKGCFEVYCSKKKFKEQMQKILGITEYVGAADLTKAVEENMNNDDVKNLLEEYVDNLALGIANIINILEPEAISIGVSMSHYEKLIFGRLKEKIYRPPYSAKPYMPASLPGIHIPLWPAKSLHRCANTPRLRLKKGCGGRRLTT